MQILCPTCRGSGKTDLSNIPIHLRLLMQFLCEERSGSELMDIRHLYKSNGITISASAIHGRLKSLERRGLVYYHKVGTRGLWFAKAENS